MKAARRIYSRDGIKIYETLPENTLPPAPGAEEVHWSPGAKEDLLWIRDNYPEEFKKYREIFTARGIALE